MKDPAVGIAGWPLRNLPASELRQLISLIEAPLLEIPKDLLDTISVKHLFPLLQSWTRQISFAGTTDFANLAGFTWDDYRRYVDIQCAAAQFLRCHLFRIFLQAETREEMVRSLERVADYARRSPEIEIVIETHGGHESTCEGFAECLDSTNFRFVVDFANIREAALKEEILQRTPGERIAYFHLRNLGSFQEEPGLLEHEKALRSRFAGGIFLWEPKTVSGTKATEIYLGER
jgi:hypothetical protein